MIVKAIYSNGIEEIYDNIERVSKEHEYHSKDCDCEICKENAKRSREKKMPDGTKQICICWLFFKGGDCRKFEDAIVFTMNDNGKTVDVFGKTN